MSTTPNMSLVVPEVLITTGPTYATQVNTALDVIDAHDHSPGKGVRVTPSGLNINADLAFNNNSATNLKSLVLAAQTSAANGAIYRNGDDLFYKRGDGTIVQITTAGGVNVSGVGGITGLTAPASATYTSATSTFSYFSGATTFAKTATGDLQIYSRAGSSLTVQAVTLKADATVSAYDLVLPLAAPTANQLMRQAASGPASFIDLLGTNNQVTVTQNTSNITLSLPQNIHTAATPTFSGLTLAGPLSGATTGGFSGQVNVGSLVSGGAVSGTTGTFTGNVGGFDITATNTLSCYNLNVSNNITMSAVPGFLTGTYIGATFASVTSLSSFTAGSNTLSNLGLTSNMITAGQIGSIGAGFGVNIIGKLDGFPYGAGYIGQVLTATMGSNVTTGTGYQNLTSLSLPTGVWEVSALVVFTVNTQSNISRVRKLETALSLTSGLADSTSHTTIQYFNTTDTYGYPILAGESVTALIHTRHVNVSSTTPIYLVGRSNAYAGGTNDAIFDSTGTIIRARRVG